MLGYPKRGPGKPVALFEMTETSVQVRPPSWVIWTAPLNGSHPENVWVLRRFRKESYCCRGCFLRARSSWRDRPLVGAPFHGTKDMLPALYMPRIGASTR